MTGNEQGSRSRLIGRRLGDFTIRAEIGRGGMGVVYEARQESMARTVALKLLPSFIGLDPDAVARFRREAEAAGRLSHPGIVPIYAVGEAEGIHYYAMELVEGPPLGALLDALAGRAPERLSGTIVEEAALDQPLEEVGGSVRLSAVASGSRYAHSCAAIAADLAAALTAAHRGLVIHRDIKPSNVLVRRSGRPVLVDFGLARDEMTVGLTQSGDALGTPAYMAPEQARGQKDLDARVDIYGLGALLYELLTLRPPFDGAHPADVMRKIVELDPTPVRTLNHRVPADLETIVHTCLAKHPEDRYAAAEALEMDLRSFLQGQPVIARRPSVLDRLRRIMKRDRRALIAAVAVLAMSVLGFVIAGVVGHQRTRTDGDRALVRARDAASRADLEGALQAYGTARGLVGARAVESAQSRHLPIVFEALYGAKQYSTLRQYLSLWPPVRRDGVFDALLERLEGRGEIRVVGVDDATVVAVRHATDVGPAAEEISGKNAGSGWVDLSPGAALRLGEHLVRVTSPGRATTIQCMTVERDATTEFHPLLIDVDRVPAGMVLVVDPSRRRASFVDRTEVSRVSYTRLLDSFGPSGLRGELTPQIAPDRPGGIDVPITGLSFAQARTAAALAGRHLMDEREYRAAASGGLTDLRYPWGMEFDPRYVAADRNLMNGPVAVDSRSDGVSPCGVLNIVGNVAEILSPSAGRGHEVVAAGGNWASRADELTIGSRQPIGGFDAARRWAGIRFAQFAPQAPSPAIAADIEAKITEMFESGVVSVLHDWIVDADGSAELALRFVGRHGEDARSRVLQLATNGFAHTGRFSAADGFGRPLDARRVGVPGRAELSEVRIDLGRTARRGQQYQWQFHLGLEPRGGLTGRGDRYSLHVPLKAVGSLRSLVRVRLPAGCRVEDVTPSPHALHHVEDCPVLVWSFESDFVGAWTLPAVVRFRRDGALTETWPARREVRSVVENFLSAAANGDRLRLESLLAEEFAQVPQGRRRDATLVAYAGRRGERSAETFLLGGDGGGFQFIDAVAVGDIVSAWLAIDWRVTERDGTETVLDGWPVRLQMRRSSEGLKLIEFAPAGRTDGGAIEDGVYRHGGLWVEFAPEVAADGSEAIGIYRLDGHLADLQVTCASMVSDGSAADHRATFSLFGVHTTVDDRLTTTRHRLTDGAWSMRPGQTVDGASVSVLGSMDYAADASSSHWLFPLPDGVGFDREEWMFLRRGQRWFLARARARGRNPDDAERHFHDSRSFFERMARSVSIRDVGF